MLTISERTEANLIVISAVGAGCTGSPFWTKLVKFGQIVWIFKQN